MKNLIILFLFSSFTLCYSGLLGAKECTFGPSFWCGSLKNAKHCSAVPHCIQTVWSQTSLPADDDGICELCQEMVVEVKKFIQEKQTQEAIKEVVAKYCNMIPVKTIQIECINISDDYIEELIQTITSEMDPHVVCATIGLCNSITVDKHLLKNGYTMKDRFVPTKKNIPDDETKNCEICKDYCNQILPYVESLPKKEVLNALLSVCGRLGSYSDSCRVIVENHFNDIYIFITQRLTPDNICKLTGDCDPDIGSNAVAKVKTGDEPCDLCTSMVNYWRQKLINQMTKEQFKQMLLQICTQTGSFKSECNSVVHQFYEPLYNIIVSEIDPAQICEAVGICGINSIFQKEHPVWTLFDMNPVDKLPLDVQPAESNLIGADEANSYKSSPIDIDVSSHGESGVLKSGKNLHNKDVCIICEFVLHFVQNALSDKPTKEEIIQQLDNVCTRFPKSFAEQCQDYVDAYGDQLIKMLVSEIDPSVICPEMGVCPGVTTAVMGDSTCVMCEFAVTQLEEMLKDNKTEQSIKSALESLCSVMPKSIRSECVDFVDTYTDQLIQLLLSELSPDEVCQELGLCHKRKVSALPPPEVSQLPVSRLFIPSLTQGAEVSSSKFQQSASCVMCEFVVRELDNLLLDNATEKEVQDGITKVCMLLPSTLMYDCRGFVEEYAKPVLEMFVARELDPQFMCTKLQLCHDAFVEALPKAIIQSVSKVAVNDAGTCRACEETMYLVKAYEGVSGKVPSVEFVVEHICRFIIDGPDECAKIVRKDGDTLFKLLNSVSPPEACQQTNYCSKSSNKHLVGSSKCTWGPSYWCKSQLHAESCSATQHCVDTVWKDAIPQI